MLKKWQSLCAYCPIFTESVMHKLSMQSGGKWKHMLAISLTVSAYVFAWGNVTEFVIRGLPRTFKLLTLTIHNFRLVKVICLKFLHLGALTYNTLL